MQKYTNIQYEYILINAFSGFSVNKNAKKKFLNEISRLYAILYRFSVKT